MTTTNISRLASGGLGVPRGVSGVQRRNYLSLSDTQKAVYRHHFDVVGQPAAICFRLASEAVEPAERPVAEELPAHPDQKLADEYASALRSVADMLNAHPDLAPELRQAFEFMSDYCDDKAVFARFARAAKEFGARIEKDYPEDPTRHFSMYAHFGPLKLRLHAERQDVCERVVVGTREVTEEVPDPKALEAIPTTTVTRTEEIVEWRCTPLLDSEAVQA